MKILVFGKNGQVAKSLNDALQNDTAIVPTFLARDEFVIEHEPITALINSYKPNFVINCCAYTDVEGAEADVESAYTVNALLPKYIGAASHALGVPVIHFSTDYVFDGTKNEPYNITDKKNPLSVYGKTKSDGEDFLLAETQNAWILRTSWVYSPYGKNFFKTMYSLLQTRISLNIVSDQIGAPTAAHELANVILSIIKQPRAYPFGLHHVSGTGETSWLGFTSEIQKILRDKNISSPTVLCGVLTKDYPTKAMRPLNSRIKSDIFHLKSWNDSLLEVFNYYEKEISI